MPGTFGGKPTASASSRSSPFGQVILETCLQTLKRAPLRPSGQFFPTVCRELTGSSQAPGFGQGAIRKKQIRKFLCPYKARAHPAEIRVSVTNRDPVTAILAKDLAKTASDL